MLDLYPQERRMELLIQDLEEEIVRLKGEKPSGQWLERLIRRHYCRGLVNVPELQEMSKKYIENTRRKKQRKKKSEPKSR